MKPITLSVIAFLLLSSVAPLRGQSAQDLALARQFTEAAQGPDYSYQYRGENELKELLRLLFTGYKFLISSQDMQTCNFQPSCSVYALHSIEAKGMLGGGLNALDRLMRCHPLALDQYQRNRKTGLAIDSVHVH
jgi:hypothetical protein